MGRPSLVEPSGRDIAGLPVALLSGVKFSGTYYAHQSSTFEDMSIGARFGLLALGVRGCRIWVMGVFELAPCLGARFYRITGEGFGGMISLDGGLLMWGPALGALVRLRLLEQLALYLSAGRRCPDLAPEVRVLRRRRPISIVPPS